MSEATELEMSEETKMKLSRYVILTASFGFIITGLYSVFRMRYSTKSGRALMMLFGGLPIGYGLSQIVNDQLRHQNPSENQTNDNKDKP